MNEIEQLRHELKEEKKFNAVVLKERDAYGQKWRLFEIECNHLQGALSDGMPKWTPTSEKLLMEQTYVLAVERQHFHPFVPTVAYYSTKAGRHMLQTAWIDSTGDYIDVTHWMRLPEAPKS